MKLLTLTCLDVGVNCDAKFEAETEEEIIELAREHARTEHHLDPIPQDVIEKCRQSIREVEK